MESVKEYISIRFKNKLSVEKYNDYLAMGEYLDSLGSKGLVMNPSEICGEYNTYALDNIGVKIFSEDEWSEFLNNSLVSDFLLNIVVRSKNTTLRKIISKISENSKLEQGEFKALNYLKELIDNSDQENGVVYVQYTSPIRFDGSEDKAIINSLKLKGVNDENK